MDDRATTVLLQAAQSYDASAFDQLYAHYADALYRYLYARCGDALVAEELMSDLWLAVVERLPQFRIPVRGVYPALSSWLYTIARYIVIGHYRKQKRQNVTLAESVPNDGPAMDEMVTRAEAQQAVRSALATLTPDQREVVVLRFFDHRSSAEVAALTGRTEGAVKALQHRAIGALARVLGGRAKREVYDDEHAR